MQNTVGARSVEVTEVNKLYSSSTVYFRQEAGGHPSRRATSLDPTASRATTEDDASSSDFDVDHEVPRPRRRTFNPLTGRRGASVDLHNFHRDIVSHHATAHIPSPAYIPSAEDTPEESPASSAANLSATQPAPPPDQGSPPQLHSLSHVQSNPSPVQRDQGLTISAISDDSIPCRPASRRRTSQVLEDFMRALRSDPNAGSVRPIPPQIDTSTPVTPILSSSLHTPLSETPSGFSPSNCQDAFNDGTHCRRRSRSRFSLSAISDAIFDSVKSHSPLTAKRKVEGTSARSDTRDSDKNSETVRGRSREKGKGKSLDLSHALIKVSEVFGLEPEEGREPRDGWKEFKKGALLPIIVPRHLVAHASTVLRNLHLPNIDRNSG